MIPRVFHQIWLRDEMPDEHKVLRDAMLALHPGWDYRLWTLDNMPTLLNQEAFDAMPVAKFKADVLRYEILARHGGVYVDTDFLFYRNLEEVTTFCDHFLVWEYTGLITNACMGFEPNHPIAWRLVLDLPASVRTYEREHRLLQVGPHYLTRLVEEQFSSALILPIDAFCSVTPTDAGAGLVPEEHPSAYAAHLWNSVCGNLPSRLAAQHVARSEGSIDGPGGRGV